MKKGEKAFPDTILKLHLVVKLLAVVVGRRDVDASNKPRRSPPNTVYAARRRDTPVKCEVQDHPNLRDI